MDIKPDDRLKANHPEPSGGMPPSMELPQKEQELIRAIQRENSNAEACAKTLVEDYNWGLAKVRRCLDNQNDVFDVAG